MSRVGDERLREFKTLGTAFQESADWTRLLLSLEDVETNRKREVVKIQADASAARKVYIFEVLRIDLIIDQQMTL